MAIRQIVSRSIKDGEIVATDLATGTAAGYYLGDNGAQGDTTTGKKDIFRVNENELNTNTTINAGDNASATGPLTIADSKTLTINGTITII